MTRDNELLVKKLILIALGVAIYAFGFVAFNMPNKLAEGGISGVTLIIHALYEINPALSSLLINIPLFIVGARILGKEFLILTSYGTVLLSVFLWLWQNFQIRLDLGDDMMLIAVVAGLFSGVGSGIVFRYGGTIGGADIIGRILEEKFGFKLGQILLWIDGIVLVSSLVYIDLPHMLYTLVACFVFSQVITIVENGGYSVRGMFIITQKSEEAAAEILNNINRGVTFLKGEGAYSGNRQDILYVALNPSEVRDVKAIMSRVDGNAFISVIEVDEVVSPDFKIRRKNYDKENQ